MKLVLPKTIQTILSMLHQHQHDAYIVGGCVRDAVLGLPIHDYDITTSALPEEVMEIFQSYGIIVIPTGLKHGTLTLRIDHENYEVTTYRCEQDYQNHRSPKTVSFTKSLKEDVKRRDFTINTLAYNEEEGLLDFQHGLQDLEDKVIRCVGNPHERFDEDALRILRALRFAVRFSFTIEEHTWLAMKEQASLLSYISKERIRDEWNRMLMSEHPQLLSLLYDANVLEQFLPEVAALHGKDQHSLWHLYDMFQHTEIAMQNTKGYSLEEKLAIVLHDIGKPQTMYLDEDHHGHFPKHAKVSTDLAEQILKRLKYDYQTIQTVCKIISCHDYYLQPNERFMRRFLAKLEGNYLLCEQIMRVQLADDLAKNPNKVQEKINILKQCQIILDMMRTTLPALTLRSLAINGRDLMELGVTGKQIGIILHKTLEMVIENPSSNHKEACIAYIKKTYLQ